MDDDDDTQVYKDDGNALTIAYQSGYYDGKKAAQPAQQPQVRTGDCLLVGVCASEGHKIQAQRPLVGLTDADWKEIEDMPDTFDQGVAWCLARLKERNA
jgi:hypothetical protein